MMSEPEQAQAAVADLARVSSDLDELKATVRALAFDRRGAVEARRVLREGVKRVMARLKTADNSSPAATKTRLVIASCRIYD
jgi:hypothetical protein